MLGNIEERVFTLLGGEARGIPHRRPLLSCTSKDTYGLPNGGGRKRVPKAVGSPENLDHRSVWELPRRRPWLIRTGVGLYAAEI